MVQFTRDQTTSIYPASGLAQGQPGWIFVATEAAKGADPGDLPSGPLSLKQTLEWTAPKWAGSLVYIASEALKATEDPGKFTAAIASILANSFGSEGGLIFLPSLAAENMDSSQIEAALAKDIRVVPFTRQGGKIKPKSFFEITLTGIAGVSADFNPGTYLSVPAEANDAYILFEPADNAAVVTLGGSPPPDQGDPGDLSAQLHFDGAANGAFSFAIELGEVSLKKVLNMGFQVVIPNPVAQDEPDNSDVIPFLAAWLPLAEPGSASGFVGFTGQVNILNPNNLVDGASETAFFFSGTSLDQGHSFPTVLSSYYRTNYGKKVGLVPVAQPGAGVAPARLVINPGSQKSTLQNGFRFSPAGDFGLLADGAEAGDLVSVLCGLSGTETVTFRANTLQSATGQRLRFHSGMPGNAPVFPLQPVSPVGPPIDPDATLLDSTYRTSWAAFLDPAAKPATPGGGHYAAAPKGAELFGYDGGQEGTDKTGMLGPKDPGVNLPGDGGLAFPMFPLAGFEGGTGQQDMTPTELELLSRQIVGPTRKTAIDKAGATGQAAPSASAAHTLLPEIAAAAADTTLTKTTTPAGFITAYDSGGKWKQLLLSQLKSDGEVSLQMGFTDLDDQLQAAFQTTDQFLIVANNKHLGPFTQPGNDPPDLRVFMPPSGGGISDQPYFFNRIDIGQWGFTARPGTDNKYGDYRNVMIVKGLKGKILDLDGQGNVTDASLVKSPDKWTMKDVFATPKPPDLSELIPLSDWLVSYCKSAWDKRDNPYFAKFASIVTDENWTGVLILKAGIAHVPDDIEGILAGVKDPTDFFAHHVGIDIGQIKRTDKEVEQKETTSMFGLVYYVDPRYDDGLPPHTIAPLDLEADQDFTLLTLKALFENSAIKKFESLAQMVLNRVFGAEVTEMTDVKPEGRAVNPNNAVLLEGGVQRNGDAVVYSLASKWPNQYALANSVLTSVEIDTAAMSTRDTGETSGQMVSWIGMTGFMNFSILPGISDKIKAVDLFSYGPDAGQEDTLRLGLSFANLGLQITTPKTAPGVEAPATPTLEMIEAEIAFNSAASHARKMSLQKSFQMELLGLMSGNASGPDKSDPASLGYLPAATQFGLSGLGSGAWHGLRFKLNLGTPGALAGKVNLDSNLLVAWSDDSGQDTGSSTTSYNAMVGIELPGAGGGGELFSLQTVLKLSVGLVQLMISPPSETDPQKYPGGFLLVLNQLALKFLGLLKVPPSGNTAFMLFGNPEAGDSTGLGWFAVYNKAKEKAKKDAAKTDA